MTITADQIRDAMIAKKITRVTSHICRGCGRETAYMREDDKVFVVRGCPCAGSPRGREETSWATLANWLAMQASDEARDRVKRALGLLG